jgi:hypothetical protein
VQGSAAAIEDQLRQLLATELGEITITLVPMADEKKETAQLQRIISRLLLYFSDKPSSNIHHPLRLRVALTTSHPHVLALSTIPIASAARARFPARSQGKDELTV